MLSCDSESNCPPTAICLRSRYDCPDDHYIGITKCMKKLRSTNILLIYMFFPVCTDTNGVVTTRRLTPKLTHVLPANEKVELSSFDTIG